MHQHAVFYWNCDQRHTTRCRVAVFLFMSLNFNKILGCMYRYIVICWSALSCSMSVVAYIVVISILGMKERGCLCSEVVLSLCSHPSSQSWRSLLHSLSWTASPSYHKRVELEGWNSIIYRSAISIAWLEQLRKSSRRQLRKISVAGELISSSTVFGLVCCVTV